MNYLVFKPEGVAQMKDTAQINYFSRFLAKYSTWNRAENVSKLPMIFLANLKTTEL